MQLTFEKGLLGLEEYKKYELNDIKDAEPFKLLQSKDEGEIGLVLISPFEIDKDYEFEISDSIVNFIGIKSADDLLIYTTVNINSDPRKTTTNLRAPIIVNRLNNKGVQIILNDERYKIKHPISKG